jgi:hypothetical protein
VTATVTEREERNMLHDTEVRNTVAFEHAKELGRQIAAAQRDSRNRIPLRSRLALLLARTRRPTATPASPPSGTARAHVAAASSQRGSAGS